MIIVTGGSGFIGSNIVRELNNLGVTDIIIVDNLRSGDKYKNIIGLKFSDYEPKEEFYKILSQNGLSNLKIEAIFHEGACSDTMNYDVNYMMKNNYEYSREILMNCIRNNIPLIYASSASVYGLGEKGFRESELCENPLNPYAFSKLLFDRYFRKLSNKITSKVIGLRYFNVFGPQEQHKGRMASIFYQFYKCIKSGNNPNLFRGINGCADGEQKRDFIYVKDIAKTNIWCLENKISNGIYNCGTGEAHTFNEVAQIVIKVMGVKNKITYCDFPEELHGKYQNFTKADIHKLTSRYTGGFTKLEDAFKDYYDFLENGGYYTY